MDQLTTRPTILIVDDTPLNLRVLAEGLRADHHVKVATSGARALELAAAAPPDLILLDVMMPGMDGYEVCRRLKRDPATKSIPVIFITARGAPEDEAHGLHLGAADYVVKPFHLPVVRARVALQLRLKRKSDLLERLVFIDGLTDVPNRRHFDTRLDEEWRRARRAGGWLAVLMIDIDDFKRFNDQYGHGAGDDCLRRVAMALLGQARRAGDVLARYGGEEFSVVLAETSAAEAAVVAERMRAAVEALGIPHQRSEAAPVVTVSVGVAACVPPSEGHPEDLLGAADEALYGAKSAGRNRVARHSPPACTSD